VHADGGALDVLVNNAGVGVSGRFAETSLEDWDWILGINLMGVVYGCQAFGPAMVERGSGHVVNLASALGYTPRATEPAYCTSKAAVLALSRCLRADWGPAGVGVSAICPGVINTAIVRETRYLGERSGSHDDVVRFFAKRGHPPEKVAHAILDAVRRDRPVVPVGPEAWIGWFAHRLLPSRATDAVARASIGGV
jgi:NAD(P)-dependent dehydrogenase (short-subunit alcohol dehydrogenase family)